MFPEIRMFTLNGEVVWILGRFIDLGFSPLLDSVNEKIVCMGEHRYFMENRFLISWNEGEVVGEEMWKKIGVWVRHHFLKDAEEEEEEEVKDADEFLKRPSKAELVAQRAEEGGGDEEPVQQEYEFRFNQLGEVMLYEVKKPFTDRPYTVVNRNFQDHMDFFSSLFVCQSWGVARTDFVFLEQCWKHLGMEGSLDLEECVKERIRRCEEEGASEPEVYRRDLEFVVELVERGERCVHFAE